MRFSLCQKIGVFLAGFVVVLGTLILTGFGTARRVATELNQVTNQALPRSLAAARLSARFEEISRLLLEFQRSYRCEAQVRAAVRALDAVRFREPVRRVVRAAVSP